MLLKQKLFISEISILLCGFSVLAKTHVVASYKAKYYTEKTMGKLLTVFLLAIISSPAGAAPVKLTCTYFGYDKTSEVDIVVFDADNRTVGNFSIDKKCSLEDKAGGSGCKDGIITDTNVVENLYSRGNTFQTITVSRIDGSVNKYYPSAGKELKGQCIPYKQLY